MKMKERMTKAQLIAELEECYRRIAEVEAKAPQSAERLSEKSLCGQSPSESGATKAPEAALSPAIRRWRATPGTPLAAGRRPEWAFQTASTDKQVRILHTKKIECSDQESKPQYLLGISEDMSERLHLEESLRENEKLAATSRLAAGIAHEINNPLLGLSRRFALSKGLFLERIRIISMSMRLTY